MVLKLNLENGLYKAHHILTFFIFDFFNAVLSADVVKVFEEAWEETKALCPVYFR